MKKSFFNFKKNKNIKNVNKKKSFFPYQNKVKTAYISYFFLFWLLGILVYIFSFFIVINLAKNGKFHISNNINFVLTPILNIILITISWFLLLIAPKRGYKNSKHGSIMFHFSFWFLVISTTLNAQLQLTYIKEYVNEIFYNWVSVTSAKIIIILSIFSLLGIQIFFLIMRRKFTFMASDYEVYMQKSINKKQRKAKKALKKENAKLINKKL